VTGFRDFTQPIDADVGIQLYFVSREVSTHSCKFIFDLPLSRVISVSDPV